MSSGSNPLQNILKFLVSSSAGNERRERLENELRKEAYLVPEAREELERLGYPMHIKTLYEKIRNDEIRATKPSVRKTMIPKEEMIRVLLRVGK